MGTPTYMGPAGSGQSCKLANQVPMSNQGLQYQHKFVSMSTVTN